MKRTKIETDLNAVRVALYEELKGMSPSEMTAYMKAKVAPLHAIYGLRPTTETYPPSPAAANSQ